MKSKTVTEYFTVGPSCPPGKPKSFVAGPVEEEHGKEHVRVFVSIESANERRDAYEQGLSIHAWDSLANIAAEIEKAFPVVPMIYLEQPSGSGQKFKSISPDSIRG